MTEQSASKSYQYVVGEFGRLVYARLEPGADVYLAIQDIAEEEGIHTGLVLSLTGAFSMTRLSMPTGPENVDAVPQIFEKEGSAEVLGGGLIGHTVETWDSPKAGIRDDAGRPYLHIHATVNIEGETYCGHVIEGCRVHELYAPSHYSLVMAEAKGIQLNLRVGKNESHAGYGDELLYHELLNG